MKFHTSQTSLLNIFLLAGLSLGLLSGGTRAAGAFLDGTVSTADATYDLTALGTADWAHWGNTTASDSFDHKAGVTSQISDIALVGAGQKTDGNWAARNSASWTDGTPTASASANGGYYYYDNGAVLGGGWSFTVPASTAGRVLYVWCGGWGAQGTLTAHLSDSSAAEYTDVQGPFLAEHVHLYRIAFQAASAAQTLTITYVKTDVDPTYHGGSVDLIAAWLQNGVAPTVSITAPTSGARFDVPTGAVTLSADTSDSDGTVSKVEFFDGAASIGADASSPFEYTWNNVANGIHTITAKATDSSGLSTVSPPVTIFVYKTSLGGQVGGSVNDSSAAYNLSALGVTTLDWAHWGRGSTYPNFDHQSTGGSQISDLTVFGSTGTVGGQQFPNSASWNDGAPTAAVTNDLGGYYYDSSASSDVGYAFTAPADTTVRTLYILAGGNWSFAQLQARLSDLSTEDYLPEAQGVGQGNYVNLYRITYKAASAGQTLNVSYTKSITANGSIDLKAAWLVSGNPGNPPTRPVISEPAANATYDASTSVSISIADPIDSDGSISKVEFYDGATKIGEDSTSPYSFTWNGAPKGPHTLTAKAIDNSGLYSVSAGIPIVVYGTGGQVTGSATVADAGYNLTTLGTVDWAHWGRAAQMDTFDHKTGANKISDITWLPATKYSWQTGNGFGGSELDGRASSWTDGTPTLSATTDKGYYYDARQPGGGWSFTVPADSTQRTLYVYCGGYGTYAQLTVHLSDWSAPDYTIITNSVNTQYQNLHKISYKAGGPGQTITVSYLKTGEFSGPGGSADLWAAWLVDAVPPVVTLTEPTDAQTFASPANITLTANATDDGTIKKVEFFDGVTKIGEDSTSPYSVTWNNAPIGTHIVTAKATDNDGAAGVSSAATISVTTTGGQLAGTASVPAANGYDLSAQNASDWVTWGRGGYYTNVDRKAGGGGQISGLTEVFGSGFEATNDSGFSVSWNDGTPTSSTLNDVGGIFCNAYILNVGWRFTLPADTTPRTLYLYCGGSENTAATLTAHLSDSSAPDFIDTQDGGGAAYRNLYAIPYNSGVAGQTLTVSYLKSTGDLDVTGTKRIYLKAAWLAGPSVAGPLTIQSVKNNGANLEITFATPSASATHKIQQTANLSSPSWSDVSGVTFASGANGTRAATFAKPVGATMFFRVVKQ